jgi:hypothetical protein
VLAAAILYAILVTLAGRISEIRHIGLPEEGRPVMAWHPDVRSSASCRRDGELSTEVGVMWK